MKSIFVMALVLLLVIPLFSILVPRVNAIDYPHDPRGEITDVDIVWSTCYQGEKQAIYVVVRNPTSTTYPYLVSVSILDPSNNTVYDSHQVGQDMGGHVAGGQSVTWGPWWYTLPHSAPNGTYHVLAGLKLYPWSELGYMLDFMGLSWCEPEATFLLKLSHETIVGCNGGAYDSDGDGYNDTAWVQVSATTNCQQDVNVWAAAVFKDPMGNIVSVHSSDVWTVPAAGQSWGEKIYFNLPVGSVAGRYSVDVYLFDTTHRSGEDDPEHVLPNAQIYDPLCPPGYGKLSLSNGRVDPASGSPSTIFSYYVTYLGSVAPTEKLVCIDGADWHAMDLYSGSVLNGVYRCQLNLSAGNHNFYFRFSNGADTVTLPVAGSISGPMVGTTWFRDAWTRNRIDNDRDGLYGQFDLCWDADTIAPQLAVYVKIYARSARHNGGVELFIGQTYLYTIYDQQAEMYIVTLVGGPGALGIWDFRLALYDARNNLLNKLEYGQDPDITGIPVDDNDNVPAAFTLTISASSGGTTTPAPGVYSSAIVGGLVANISATPYANYAFDHWKLNGVNIGSTDPINVTLDRNLDLHAVFVPLAYNVTVVAHCNAEGADVGVAITEDGALTGLSTPYTFTGLSGSHNFTVPGADANGHAFMNWSSGEGTVTISVSSGGTYTAYYGASPPPTYNVTVVAHCNAEGADVGVAITEDGSSTGFNTSHTFAALTGTHNFTVPSTDNSGHPFLQWSTNQTSTTITVSSNGNYTAYYQASTPPTYTVTISAHCNTEGLDVGIGITEDGSATGYNATHMFSGLSGSHTFTVPSADTSGHPFLQWSTGQTSTTITVSSAGTYTAYYQASTYNVTINAHCNAEGADVGVAITEDGALTGLSTPYTFTGLSGSHNFTVPGADANGHYFKQWSTGSTSTTIAVSSGGAYTAYYEQVLGPIVSISPPSGSVKVGQNVTIAVNVANVTNLYTWQITLHFNSSIVECAGAWYPDNHVFVGRPFIPVAPSIGQDNIAMGASLVGSGRFDGSGTLCLINFTGLAQGSCPLQFDVSDTFLLDSDLNSIHITIIQGSLTVSGEHTLMLGGRATDVDGSGKVDMKDLGLVCHAFNTSPEDPSWNPACDVNHDGKVDMKDIGLVARDFGKTA